MPRPGAPWPPRMRLLFDPHLVNGPFGDPGLFVDCRDERRALLFDLGDLRALPPRKLLRVSHAFVSHTHMDHFAGFDELLRVVLGRKPHLTLVGGPGFVDQVEHKLRAYAWNVVHRYEVELVLEAISVAPDGGGERARFSSRTAFARDDLPPFRWAGDVLLDAALFRVRARFVDHGIPCLAFALEEKARVKLDKTRLDALGLSTGAWLRTLKQAVLTDAPDDTPIDIEWRDGTGTHRTTRPLAALREVVLAIAPGQRIGYVTDLRHTAANLEQLEALLAGVDRLYIEAVFLHADLEHAQRKHHLTARQAGEIARAVGAHGVVPFHFSPRYTGHPELLEREVVAAWSASC